MNTEYIHEFVVLAETKNFWEASERLFMNQSTLSKHIKSLESELGVPLFTRTTRRVELTNYGRAYLPYARTISDSEYEGLTTINRLQNIENGLLTLGTIPSMPQYQVTLLLAQFQSKYPNTTVRVTEDDPINLQKYLENKSCEIIFTRETKSDFENNFLNNSQIKRIPYLKDRLVVLLPKKHPLASKTEVTLQNFKDENFCLIKEGSLMYEIGLDACRRAGFIPNIIFTSHRIDSILDMVTNQDCVALLMDKHLEKPTNAPTTIHDDAPWTYIPVVPETNSQMSICYNNTEPLSKTAQLFVDFCTAKLFGE